MTGAVISRVKHEDSILMPKANTMLLEGDYVQAVGSEEALNQFAVLVGEREEGELPLDQTQEIESLLLTKKDMINKQLGDLNLQRNFGCTVTRIRRSGIDLSPSPDLALKFGDKLMVVGEREGLRGVARLLGNNAKQLSDTDFFPIAMGIVLGVLFGKINISFSDSVSFSPGLTGGVLMVALLLSAVGKTGPILWSMSGPANQLLRQLGLLLFWLRSVLLPVRIWWLLFRRADCYCSEWGRPLLSCLCWLPLWLAGWSLKSVCWICWAPSPVV